MSKFKAGDKIIGTSGLTGLGMYEGKPYTVKECSDSSMTLEECFCKLTGRYFTFTPNYYDLYEASIPETATTKFNKGDKVRCVSQTPAGGVEVGGIYTIKDQQHHYGTYFGVTHNHVKLEEVSSTPNESCLELYDEEVKQPTSYREMSPESTVKVKIGDYEFDCPIKELLLVCKLSGSISGEGRATSFWENIKDILQFEIQLRHKLGLINIRFENLDEVYQEYFKPFYDKQEEKEALMKDIEEQKAILKNQQEFLKELEDKYNSL